MDRHAARYTAELVELVRLSRDGEHAVQAHMEHRFRELGGRTEVIRYDPRQVSPQYEFAHADAIAPGERTSVAGVWPGANQGRSLLVFAHPDVEPFIGEGAWGRPPFEGLQEEGRLYGWGVADDLAGLAAMVSALEAVIATGVELSGTIILASAPSKGNARGILPVLERVAPVEGAVYIHPAESGRGLADIKSATPGTLRLVVRIAGRPPETSEPDHMPFADSAVNPIDRAFFLTESLRSLSAVGSSDGVGTQIVYIAAGARTKLHRVPAECELGISITFPPPKSVEDARAGIAEAIRRRTAEDPWLSSHPPDLQWVSGTADAEMAESHPLVRTVSWAIAKVTGRRPVLYAKHAASDIRHPTRYRGIPTVGFGPLAGNLVQVGGADEWVDLREQAQTIKSVAAIIIEWCGVKA